MLTLRRIPLFVAAFAIFVGGITAAEPAQGLLNYLPAGGVAAVEVSGLEPLINRLESSEALQAYLKSPAYQTFRDSDRGKKFFAGKAIVEAQLGQNLWALGKNYFGRRMVLAIYPPANRPQPDAVLLIEAKDAAAIGYLKEKLTPLIALAGDKITPSDRPDGGWQLNPPEGNTAVLLDRWLLSSNNPSLLEFTIERLQSRKANRWPMTPIAAKWCRNWAIRIWSRRGGISNG